MVLYSGHEPYIGILYYTILKGILFIVIEPALNPVGHNALHEFRRKHTTVPNNLERKIF